MKLDLLCENFRENPDTDRTLQTTVTICTLLKVFFEKLKFKRKMDLRN